MAAAEPLTSEIDEPHRGKQSTAGPIVRPSLLATAPGRFVMRSIHRGGHFTCVPGSDRDRGSLQSDPDNLKDLMETNAV
jgi:hypothetical protein